MRGSLSSSAMYLHSVYGVTSPFAKWVPEAGQSATLRSLGAWPPPRDSADLRVSCPGWASVSSLCPRPQDCTICMERLVTASGYEGVLRHKGVRPELVGRLGRCGHMYHLLCLVAMYSNGNKVGRTGQWVEPVGGAQAEGRGRDAWGPHRQPLSPPQDGSLQCPTCKAIYGEKTGTQPPGKMEFHLIPHSLPGFADTQTIRIVYDIPTGIQVSPAPSPPPLASTPLNSAEAPPTPVHGSSPCSPPYRAPSTPTQARSSPQEASHATAICPTMRRAGR